MKSFSQSISFLKKEMEQKLDDDEKVQQNLLE